MYSRGVDDFDIEGSECTVGVSMIVVLVWVRRGI